MANDKNNVLDMKVPIIGGGQVKAVIHEIRPLIVATCPCGNPKPIVIDQFSQVVECTQCHDEHFLVLLEVKSDGENGVINVQLGRRASTTTAAKMAPRN